MENIIEENKVELEERVVFINRCSKATKGGRSMSFSALVVVGDRKGRVGIGYGKANETPDAIKKAINQAKLEMFEVKMYGSTIPYRVEQRFNGAKVVIIPASEGTGLIAGGGARAVLELAGVGDALSKSLGSNNVINVVRATAKALRNLKSYEHIKNKLK